MNKIIRIFSISATVVLLGVQTNVYKTKMSDRVEFKINGIIQVSRCWRMGKHSSITVEVKLVQILNI